MRLPVLIAADGAPWEAGLVLALDGGDLGVAIARRCVDIVDALAVAASGQARAALIAAGLARLDTDAVERLVVAGVVPIGVFSRDDAAAEATLRALGFIFTVPAEADPKVIASVIEQAVESFARPDLDEIELRSISSRSFSSAGPIGADRADAGNSTDAVDSPTPNRPTGSIIAVWGPTGAPGRTTVAVSLADEIARLGRTSLLIDADVYGGIVAAVLGLLDESAGLAAACRQAGTTRLDAAALAAVCWQVRPTFRVLTGIPRAERWPELRPSALASVLAVARGLADFVVVDCGFCLESDEELSFDSVAPRRNGATLAVLDAADLVLIVGAADPLGLQRLVRGLTELRDAEVRATSWVVLNKVRSSVVPGNPADELRAALQRFTGRVPAALLPFDQDAVDSATAGGKTLAEARPASALRRALVELAASIAGVAAPPPRRHRRGR